MLSPILHESDALTIIRGESKTLRLEVTQDDPTGETRSLPVDLTDAVVYFTVKEKPTDATVLIQKTSLTPSEAEVTNARGGVANIYLQPRDTFYLDEDDYVFDIWIRYTTTEKRLPVIRRSTFRVVAGVTVVPLP